MKRYKTIWDNLSTNYSDAKYVVGYLGGEEEIQSNGQITTEFLRSVLQIKPTDKVLDIGCGIARVGRELAPYCGEWHGCDISGNMIAYAQERTANLPNVYLHELPEPNLSVFNDGYFDCVYSTIVFMHLDKIEVFNYMREAFRVLAPGGKAYFDTYNISAPEAWEEFIKILEAFPLGERPGHVSQFSSPPEMRKFMVEAKFVDIDVDDASPQLVVTVGRKPEDPGYERPSSPVNTDMLDRIATMTEQRNVQVMAAEQAASDSNVTISFLNGRIIIPYDEWQIINQHVVAKDAYIKELEEAIAKKNRYITTVENRVRKHERTLGTLPVRLALRLSKGRPKS
jgi:ubiquinone/menaquinone biosynthesis C-methylase UbiE